MIIEYNGYIYFGREYIGSLETIIYEGKVKHTSVVWNLSVFHIGPLAFRNVKRFGFENCSSIRSRSIDAACDAWRGGGPLPDGIEQKQIEQKQPAKLYVINGGK